MENTNIVNEKSTILLIDDHPMLRNGVKQLISLESSLQVIGEAGDGKTGIQIAEEQDPDLILLDLNMPGMNGFETLDELRKRELSGRIILFTVSNYSDDLVNALKRGADGYLLKDMEPEELIVALKEAASGKLVVSPTLASVLAESLRDNTTQDDNNIASLTPREADILELISQGLSNKMIARKLDIAESTVKVHVKHLLKKLNLKSRVEAAVWVLQQK
ncbi:two-component system response regulator NarL [Providencia huaxiensis]|uniref:Two-component system response regulator NarL n=1 Tax=Providencia huaxiensis TaxID=2027290 RepID=A0A345LXP1_9GAMM|nr:MULTISPECIES: two-component system response regulator NarL [Providencia]AXH62881.1 two-component system response regulator NarL [Providencia huaxiensis]MBN6363637.1 two-component system response regulator NarL [Providencia huaxiensis]MBQ0270331.1 two-component system response regulator NarL [Providencia huaxiensis]MBQ0535513.1 two-component system response regulator NarL [Providencia huaxiensis]MBQ0590134.1 two-component system response regulator NarL [Providencia huaxiensis]